MEDTAEDIRSPSATDQLSHILLMNTGPLTPLGPEDDDDNEWVGFSADVETTPRSRRFYEARDSSPSPAPTGSVSYQKFLTTPQLLPGNPRAGVFNALPFHRYNEKTCDNLYDLLRVELPTPPIFLKSRPNFLASTKGLSQAEQGLSVEDQMTSIVFAQDMLLPLFNIASRTISTYKLDWKDHQYRDFASSVHPYLTQNGLPPVIQSEKDSEDWVLSMLVRPAVNAHLAHLSDAVPIYRAPAAVPEDCGYYVSSSDGTGGVVPDALIMDGVTPLATIEVKTHNVISHGKRDIFFPFQTVHTDATTGTKCPGRAIKFIWPEEVSDITDKESRILLQVRVLTLSSM